MLATDLPNLYTKKYSNLLQTVRVMIFLYATTVSLIKLMFYIKNKKNGYLFFFGSRPSVLYVAPQPSPSRPLGPTNFIVTVSRKMLVWPRWSIKIIHNIHNYEQKNFSWLACTKCILHLAICQLWYPHSGLNKHNTWFYNLISVPQITQLLLEDAK